MESLDISSGEAKVMLFLPAINRSLPSPLSYPLYFAKTAYSCTYNV